MTRGARGTVAGVLAGVLALLAHGRAAAAEPAENPERSIAETLRERLDQMQATGRVEVEKTELVFRRGLSEIYERSGYRPFWTPERLGVLLELVRESEKDGLTPEDYHLAALSRLAPALGTAGADAVTRANVDLLATDAFALLVYHLYLGKVDPKSLDARWNFEPRPIGEQGGTGFVLDALTQGRLREAVEAVRLDHWWYQRARAALAEYRGLAARGGWGVIPGGRTLKAGMSDPRVPALRHRLAATGELTGESLESTVFDEPLAAAVGAFQARHRLPQDGAVGPGTLAELNVPVEARILQIRVNLERARWALHEITPGELVIVDVAGFEVAYVKDQEPIWRARIQIGKPYRQTPIFKSEIEHVVFNPTWTVPPGILAKDILPAVRRDPGYLAHKRLDVIDRSGRKVDPAGIDWSRQSARSFPYVLRQEPGPDNALGRVKIMFPNPYAVYLHDTPSKALFEESARAFSSGCIRVERPLELTRLLLNDPDQWDERAIDEVVAAGKTRTVRLRRPVPVLLMYWTIAPDSQGRTVFKRDPYGRDPPLARALDAPFRPRRRPSP
ncbi:MAG: L,D-transpeptidase family protein [Acidobacteriota bacterium]